jgi:hypothetical protein
METPIAIIVVLALIMSVFYSGLFSDQENGELKEETSQPITEIEQKTTASNSSNIKRTGTASVAQPQTSAIFIDAYITKGAEQGEVIDDTNKVTFEFDANVYPKDTKDTIYFETKIPGIDDTWKKSTAKKRTIALPSGKQEYTFFVRARINDSLDLIPDSRTFKLEISPFFEKVRISNVRVKTSSRPSLITLNTYLQKGETINITGWYFEGTEGEVKILQGVEKYYHFYASYTNEDIIIKQGDRIYLAGTFNPLGKDRNFRANKCLGYLIDSFNFPIPISKNCPRPAKDDVSYLDPCCQQFILGLSTCQIPDYSEKISIRNDLECTSYINQNLNNMGCFQNYSEDDNFLGKEWHIYLDQKDIVTDEGCDILYLKDKNGLTVDSYSYGKAVCQ